MVENNGTKSSKGMTAAEIMAEAKVSDPQRVLKDYQEWISKIRLTKDWMLIAGIVGAIGAGVYWRTWAAGIMAVLFYAQLLKWRDHREAYMNGYQTGYEDGVKRTRGITPEMDKFVDDTLIDQELKRDQALASDQMKQPRDLR